MNELSTIYLAMLEGGLSSIRDFAEMGNSDICKIEAEHLHNIPKYARLSPEHKLHALYFNKERKAYIRAIAKYPEVKERAHSILYEESWKRIRVLIQGNGPV